ncbi:Acetyltransferase (GNAT) domain containing protein, putative [Angomonas deanei]|uniref:Acetyltransferase (GNAT) domain containing protein, putative n=1 Tax=Angomonas deanei TaxID=59799 RepID=A0A7G2CHB9_9TRYP|nr:Acetyltransferase (GNAT) domain containing protein, putative [Angomonas deanei]
MINETVYLQIPGRLLLVPYLPHHVGRYHEWMCRPELLAATESEPLSLQEERENQVDWLQSLDKLTFIIYACEESEKTVEPLQWSGASTMEENTSGALRERYTPTSVTNLLTGEVCQTERPLHTDVTCPEVLRDDQHRYVMVGDCNLFLLTAGDNNMEVATSAEEEEEKRTFEVEVMIAETGYRRHGLAEGAVRLLITYALTVLEGRLFLAKVLEDNAASISLFENKLNFKEMKRVPVFHEIHLKRYLHAPTDVTEWIEESGHYSSSVPFLCGPYQYETSANVAEPSA